MTEAEKYVTRYLKSELEIVRTSAIAVVRNGLDIYEKTLIFYYTGSGYGPINASLRRSGGKRGSRAAILLEDALNRLPDWQGAAFRSCRLTKRQVAEYAHCARMGSTITEASFLSTSRNMEKLEHYPDTNCQMDIYVRHGKSIEECSRLGTHHPPNEEEVLVLPGTTFQILDVNDSGSSVLITMEEI